MTPTEEQRLEAEVRRIDAEAAKFDAERAAIQRGGKWWWVTSELFRHLISIAITVGLLSVWFKVQLEPLMLAKTELGKVQIELESARNQLAQEQLKKDVAILTDKNRELLVQQTKLQQSNEARIREIEKRGAGGVSAAQKKEIAELRAQLKELQEAKADTERRLKNLYIAAPPLNLSESLTTKVLPPLSGVTVPRPICVTKSKTCPYYSVTIAFLGQSCTCSGPTLADSETGHVSAAP